MQNIDIKQLEKQVKQLDDYQLNRLKVIIIREITNRTIKEKDKAVVLIRQMAEQHNISPKEIKIPQKRRPKKYQDPISGRLWAGVGKKPRWIQEAIDRGQDIEDFKI